MLISKNERTRGDRLVSLDQIDIRAFLVLPDGFLRDENGFVYSRDGNAHAYCLSWKKVIIANLNFSANQKQSGLWIKMVVQESNGALSPTGSANSLQVDGRVFAEVRSLFFRHAELDKESIQQ